MFASFGRPKTLKKLETELSQKLIICFHQHKKNKFGEIFRAKTCFWVSTYKNKFFIYFLFFSSLKNMEKLNRNYMKN